MHSIPHIIRAVTTVVFGTAVDIAAITRPHPTKMAGLARHVAMFLARQYGYGLAEIAGAFQLKSHASVIYAVQKIKAIHKTDPAVRDILTKSREALK